MLRTSFTSLVAVLASVFIVSADFDDFFFASNASNYLCPGVGFGCEPPMICSHESVTNFHYCCAPGATDAVCWKGSESCDGGGKKTPSGSQQSCSNGDNAFCCLKSLEECTQTKNQVNICWSTIDNPVANLSDAKLNDTFLSLSSARPRASSFPVSLAQLQATATPTTSLPVSLSASSLSSVSATIPANTDSPVTESAEKKGISGGAIGGIVGGVLGGLALIGVAGFLLFRRRRANSKSDHAPVASGSPSESGEHENPYELNAYQQQHAGMAQAPAPTEKYGFSTPNTPYRDVPEVPGIPIGGHNLHEMQGSSPAEMDGSGH